MTRGNNFKRLWTPFGCEKVLYKKLLLLLLYRALQTIKQSLPLSRKCTCITMQKLEFVYVILKSVLTFYALFTLYINSWKKKRQNTNDLLSFQSSHSLALVSASGSSLSMASSFSCSFLSASSLSLTGVGFLSNQSVRALVKRSLSISFSHLLVNFLL